MPYHRLGISKYTQYGMDYPLNETEPELQPDIQEFRKLVESFGLQEVTGKI